MASLSAENPLRNAFNDRNVGVLSENIKALWPAFEAERFLAETFTGWEEFGFGDRSTRIREQLRAFLPHDFPVALELLLQSLGPELSDEAVASLDDFIVMPQCSFVTHYGRDHFELCLNALYEMTKRFSAEGDLRVLFDWSYERTMQALHEWVLDPNPHVRRLVSEGIRPRLPLASRIPRFIENPSPVFALLEFLKGDPSLYVRRSVANNLNDIAKDHPDLVAETLARWSSGADKNTQWLVRHAARTLIKKGHKATLSVFGFSETTDLHLGMLSAFPETVDLGAECMFAVELKNLGLEPLRLSIDYSIQALKESRTEIRQSVGVPGGKIYKGKVLEIAPGESKLFEKRHRVRNTSGRRYRSGPYQIRVFANGTSIGAAVLHVIVPD